MSKAQIRLKTRATPRGWVLFFYYLVPSIVRKRIELRGGEGAYRGAILMKVSTLHDIRRLLRGRRRQMHAGVVHILPDRCQ